MTGTIFDGTMAVLRKASRSQTGASRHGTHVRKGGTLLSEIGTHLHQSSGGTSGCPSIDIETSARILSTLAATYWGTSLSLLARKYKVYRNQCPESAPVLMVSL